MVKKARKAKELQKQRLKKEMTRLLFWKRKAKKGKRAGDPNFSFGLKIKKIV